MPFRDAKKTKISKTTVFVPVLVFIALATLTVSIWQAQVVHQRTILVRHTEDVGIQSARRLEIFVESHLKIAEIFTSRWVTHEAEEFSKTSFEEFAGVLLDQVEGYHCVIFLPSNGEHVWVVPHDAHAPATIEAFKEELSCDDALTKSETTLSTPRMNESSTFAFFATVPITEQDAIRGHALVDFLVTAIIDDCFHERIRSEFEFEVEDGTETVFSHHPDDDGEWFVRSPIRATREFSVRNRTWRLTMVPRVSQNESRSGRAGISVLLLGIALSTALALIVFMLQRRMELFRSARDRALSEIEEREKAESALVATRSRYKSVFESTTDGIAILDENSSIVEANAAACTMHGYEPGELGGTPVRNLITEDHQYVLDRFMHILEKTGIVRLDSVHVRKDRTRFDVEVRGTDFKFMGESRVLVVWTDVSERKHAQERLAHLSRQVLLAQEDERARLSRDLHDELGQLLTAQHLELDWLKSRMKPIEGEDSTSFDNALKLVEEATSELRRICKGLRPPLLDDLGIEPAVTLLVEEFQERTTIVTDLDLQIPDDTGDIPAEDALCLYRVLQESLTNVSRHAEAGHVSISLAATLQEFMLSVYDDGTGFDVSDEQGDRGSGITGMHERAHLVGGTIDVRSTPSEGTRVVLTIPRREEKR